MSMFMYPFTCTNHGQQFCIFFTNVTLLKAQDGIDAIDSRSTIHILSSEACIAGPFPLLKVS